MANPDWVRDEIILALDLYVKDKTTAGNNTHSEVISLSDLLNKLPIFRLEERSEKFRNANGVGMKIANFQRFDPEYTGKGLSAGSKLEEKIWDEFYHDQDRLRSIAQAIRGSYNVKEISGFLIEEEDEDFTEAPEGKILTALHKFRERSQKLVKKKKESVLRQKGRLDCEACGFNFEINYGDKGKGFIECHHDKPVSTLGDGGKTSIDDLRLVCSNCHSVIHRSSPWLTLDELRGIITSKTI
jgi:5-methylcytosine-specific restriction enzyme A